MLQPKAAPVLTMKARHCSQLCRCPSREWTEVFAAWPKCVQDVAQAFTKVMRLLLLLQFNSSMSTCRDSVGQPSPNAAPIAPLDVCCS